MVQMTSAHLQSKALSNLAQGFFTFNICQFRCLNYFQIQIKKSFMFMKSAYKFS